MWYDIHKLEVQSVLTFQTFTVTQTLLDGLNECRVNLAPALMSSPAAASLIVDGVCHYCTRFTQRDRLLHSATNGLPQSVPQFIVSFLTRHIHDSEGQLSVHVHPCTMLLS